MKTLKPIREQSSDYDEVTLALLKLFREEIYLPLMKELGLGPKTLKNSKQDIVDAIRSGRIVYSGSRFTGRFSTSLSRNLRELGAAWDRKHGSFTVPLSRLPSDVKAAIELSEERMKEKLRALDKKLAKVAPAELAEKLKLEKIYDTTIHKVEKKFKDSVKGIAIAPEITAKERQRISAEYTKNMRLYIQDFAEKEIVELRKSIEEHARSGNRYEGAIKAIQKSYGVTYNKAKFLARQETSLLVTKYKQIRYQDAGVNRYKWTCVVGSAAHPVRPMHKNLDGKVFDWDHPPIVNEKGERKNPGQDYGCRCVAIPIVSF